MDAGTNRRAKVVAWRGLALAAGLVLLGACGKDREAGTTTPEGEARREGEVTIGGDHAIAERLTWRRPIAVFDPADPQAAHRRAATALAEGRLFEDSEAAIPIYLALLDFDQDDSQAAAGLDRALLALREAGDAALAEAGDEEAALRRAHAIAAVMRTVGIDRFKDGTAYLERLDLADELWALNEAGERALAEDKLGEQGGDGALPLFRKVLALQPDQPRAMQGVAAAESGLIRRAEEAAIRADFVAAERWLAEAEKVRPGFGAVDAGREQVEEIRSFQIALLRDEGLALVSQPERRHNLDKARELLAVMLRIALPGDESAKELRTRIDLATHYGLMRPGQRFTDALEGGGRGPRMVVVPHGGFRMGARDTEPDATDSERPSRYVRFDRGFAVSTTEVTVGEFRRFLQTTGHVPRAERRGHSLVYDERGGTFVRRSGVDWRHDYMGRPASEDMPVLHVSAKDAEAYAHWLSERSGQRYRLPSEAEFEYVLRAGQPGRYPWGDQPPTPGTGNLTGGGDRSAAGRSWGNAFVGYRDGFWGPAPVARFRANAFGAHDMEGNVSEWVADCWHDGYRRAPTNGEAWVNPGCRTRVVRGGAWSNAPAQTRAAWRRQADYDNTNAVVGFRVVREI